MTDRLGESSDATLTLAIARYDDQALAEVYRRHAGSVFRLAQRLLYDRAVAEEVVQEVFLRLWNDPTRFDPLRGSLRTFLLTQTHRRAIDVLRADSARRRREERDARRLADGEYDLEREVGDLATSDVVKRSLTALPESERQAIGLAYFGGYTYREVAELLGEPEGTVKSRIRKGLRTLRGELLAAGIATGER